MHSGGFGRVFEARLFGAPVAVKEIATPEEDIAGELHALSKARHPGVVNFVGANVETPGTCYIVTEFVPGGDLVRRRRRAKHPQRL